MKIDNIMPVFAIVLFVLATIAWLYFIVSGKFVEMWLANTFMWISILIGRSYATD